MIRIECKCKVCKSNAARLGHPMPLVAEVPAALATLTKSAQGRHGLVHMAHDPHAVTGILARARTGVRPA